MSDPTIQSTAPLLVNDAPFGEGHPNLEFIKGRLPAWYLDASTELREALRQSQLYSQFSQRALEPIRKRLMSVQAFAEPLLVYALEKRFNLRLDLHANQLVTMHTQTLLGVDKRTPFRQTLLQAALQNFEASEVQDDAFGSGAALLPVNGLQLELVEGTGFNGRYPRFRYRYTGVIDIKAEQFAMVCRSLDLGGKYQAHLDSVFKPAGSAAQAVAEKFMANERHAFEVLIHIARMKQQISAAAYTLLLEMTKRDGQPLWEGRSIRFCQLRMLNTPEFAGSLLYGALLIEPEPDGDGDQPCWVYMPAEPQDPLKEYASFTAFTDALRRKLNSNTYQGYFLRFVGVRDSHLFFGKLNARLNPLRSLDGNPFSAGLRERAFDERADLRLERLASVLPPFQQLYQHLLDKTYNDSRVLAVPTEEEDRRSRLARLWAYESYGLDLLNVAAFFVPVLGEIMAVVATAQLLEEAFIGVEDWQQGDTDEALTHLFDIAENLAQIALLGSAVGVQVPEPSTFIEGLIPVRLNNGSTRLWKPDLTPFQQDVTLPAWVAADAEGRIEVEGKTWLPLAGKFYQIELDPALQKWRIKHPTDARRYSPVLEHEVAGRWRHDAEQPMAWESDTLFRRLHGSMEALPQETVERIMAVTGIDDAVLRQVHGENLELPALLRDSIQRFQTEPVIDPPSLDPLVLLIQRDFPGLPSCVATEILQSANGLERARMSTASRLPLRLAEQAREYQQALRLNRANEGFYLSQTNNPDTAIAGFHMLEQLPGWPQDLALDVRESSVSGKQLASIGGQATTRQVLVKSTSGYQAFDTAGVALGQPDQAFFVALLQAIPETTRIAIGLSTDSGEQTLRVMLGNIAVTQRERVAQSLGMQPIKPGFKSPSRLEDGRVGYPLSGRMRVLFAWLGRRGSRFSPELAVKSLYPSLPEVEVRAFLEQIQAEYAGGSGGLNAYVRQRLQALEVEYNLLEGALDNWVAEGDGVRLLGRNFPVVTQADKLIAATRIKNCWRRQSTKCYLDTGEFIGYKLDLSGLAMGRLPPITARFDHVGSLVVNEVDMTAAEANTLLDQFRNLYWLSLSGNELTTVPEALAGQTRLVQLSLQNNPLTLDEASAHRLHGLVQLQGLSLSQCPVGPLLDLRQFSHLSLLNLRSTGIERVPVGLVECEALVQADLRDNRISDLSDAVLRRMSGNSRRIQLHDNPVSARSLDRARELLNDMTRLRMGLSRARTHARHAVGTGSLWVAGVASHQLHPRMLIWSDLQAERHSDDFFRVLDDLTQSNDYRNSKLVLTRRVWAVIDAASRDSGLRDELFAMAEHPDTCGDGAAIIFNDMEIQVLLFKVMEGLRAGTAGDQRVALFSLARGLDRLDEIEKIALGDITRRLAANEHPDQAEVRLAYRVRIAQRLELPEQPQGMLFNELSGVSSRMIDIAEQWIRQREHRPEFLQSIIAREFWMSFLERHYAPRFESVQAPFYERLETLDGARENITDESYLAQIQVIQQARASAVNALALELTQTIKQEVMPVDSTMPPVET